MPYAAGRLTKICILLLFFAASRTCATAEAATAKSAYNLYKSDNGKFKFSFEYPPNWVVTDEILTNNKNSLILSIYLPDPQGEDEKRFAASIFLWIMPTKDIGGRYQDVTEKADTYLRGDAAVVLNKKAIISDAEGYEIMTKRATKFAQGPDNMQNNEIINHRILVEKDKYIYNLNLSYRASDGDKFEPIFQRLMDTFEF